MMSTHNWSPAALNYTPIYISKTQRVSVCVCFYSAHIPSPSTLYWWYLQRRATRPLNNVSPSGSLSLTLSPAPGRLLTPCTLPSRRVLWPRYRRWSRLTHCLPALSGSPGSLSLRDGRWKACRRAENCAWKPAAGPTVDRSRDIETQAIIVNIPYIYVLLLKMWSLKVLSDILIIDNLIIIQLEFVFFLCNE